MESLCPNLKRVVAGLELHVFRIRGLRVPVLVLPLPCGSPKLQRAAGSPVRRQSLYRHDDLVSRRWLGHGPPVRTIRRE